MWGTPRTKGGLDLLKFSLGEIFVCVDSEIHSKDITKLIQHGRLRKKQGSSSAWEINSLLSRRAGKQSSSSL